MSKLWKLLALEELLAPLAESTVLNITGTIVTMITIVVVGVMIGIMDGAVVTAEIAAPVFHPPAVARGQTTQNRCEI